MTRPSRANTTADRKALLVRNSIDRSFRAICQAAASVSDTGPYGFAVGRRVFRRIDGCFLVEPHERPGLHDRGMRRERKSLDEIVGDDDHSRACRGELPEERG